VRTLVLGLVLLALAPPNAARGANVQYPYEIKV
jgi:hypothetical protein